VNGYSNKTIWNLKWLLGQISSPIAIGILASIAIGVGFLAANGMAMVAFGAVGILFGLLVVHRCIMDPIAGYYLLLFIAFFSEYPGRLLGKRFPVTTFVEVLVLILFIGTYWRARKDENQKGNLMKYSISSMLIIYVLFYLIQAFNPDMGSPAGWFFNSKRFTMQILWFVISYRLINTPDRVRYFIKFWVVMSFIAALYGCYQQWFGFLPVEINTLDEHERGLLFQGGIMRKFSFLEGVVTFGNLCGCMAVVALVLALSEKKRKRKYQLGFIFFILFLGMSYSGTRTFTLMIPAGIALYVLMTLKNKATIMTVFITLMAVLFIFFAPIDNPVLNRMRSTFDAEDESLNVRTVNRKYIQPYVYAHPFGGGVATSGVEGVRFNPTHPLAGFPPDSGLLKIALDMGWIGLIISMAVFLMVLYQGIYYYFKIQNEEYKKYVLASTCAIFAVIITLYAQVTIGQMPTVFFIFGMMSIFKRLMEFDERERNSQVQRNTEEYVKLSDS
jgi:putative inorganic carbon (hco3(-)) transporter